MSISTRAYKEEVQAATYARHTGRLVRTPNRTLDRPARAAVAVIKSSLTSRRELVSIAKELKALGG